MYDNIFEDAQEIKKRLSALGENVDETVICELLKSCGPEYKLDSIISMITENWETSFQNTSNKVGTSVTHDNFVIQHDTNKISKHNVEYTQRSSVEDIYVETSDVSSDYDDYRDDYYSSINDDDISVVDTVTRSLPSPLELCDNTSPPNHNSEAILPEAEFLEENNNDPNNNLDSVQMLQELQNNSPDIDHKERGQSMESCMELTGKGPESPKPGCSKDSHDAFVSYEDPELCTEAKRINEFLPQFKYNVVYETLCHNRMQNSPEDRLEVTLFNLLEERLKSKTLFKRKVSNDICTMEHKKSILEKVSTLDNTNSDTNQQSIDSFAKTKLSKLDRSNNDINTCNVQSREKSVASEVDSKIRGFQQIKNRYDKNLIRPAKLSCKLEQSVNLSPIPLAPILQAPKLTYITKGQIQQKFTRPVDISQIQKFGRIWDGLKQKPDEHVNTLANGQNKKASDMNVVNSRSPFWVVEDKTIISTDETLPDIGTKRTKLLENKTLHSLQSNSTKNISTSTIPKTVNSSESEIKDNLNQEDDISTSQGAMLSTNTKTNATNPTEQLSKPLQQSVAKQDRVTLSSSMVTYASKCKSGIAYSINKNDKASTSLDLTMDNVQQDMTTIDKTQVGQRDTTNNTNDEKLTLKQKDKTKMYCKLISIFPCIDTKYIKQLCIDYMKDDMLSSDETVLLQDLVEHLLGYQDLPKIKKAESAPKSNTFDVNEQYASLLDIFPNADPTYLRDIAEQVYSDPDKMKEFVQSKLENPDYPTREQYLAKKKITEQQKQYTTDFQVQQFLEIFPDPFSHFENDKRKCQFKADAVEFLKHHFNKIKVNTLLSMYAQHEHNLSLTAKDLETINSDMKSKRTHPLMQTEDIPLLQECAFIQHKAKIQKYLAELKEKEEKEFNDLKARNELFECQCCFDNECMPSKCSTCEDGHIFCNSCITKSTDVKLADGETHIHCLLNCGNEFHLSVLQQVLLPTKFSILLQKRQEAEVMAAGLEGLVSCPFCHFASIPPQEDKVFKCFNPDCMKESCRLCKELNHLPLKCNEVKCADAARLYLEEKMTEALVRKCYRCGRTFFKEEGCNKMTCICGAQMCYICDKPVTDYKHFSGQGTTRSDLCPLWSDNHRMNAEAVIKVCHDTMKQIKEKNPQVEINADALLPKLPHRTRGPHEDIAHADMMPAHINRIVRHIP